MSGWISCLSDRSQSLGLSSPFPRGFRYNRTHLYPGVLTSTHHVTSPVSTHPLKPVLDTLTTHHVTSHLPHPPSSTSSHPPPRVHGGTTSAGPLTTAPSVQRLRAGLSRHPGRAAGWPPAVRTATRTRSSGCGTPQPARSGCRGRRRPAAARSPAAARPPACVCSRWRGPARRLQWRRGWRWPGAVPAGPEPVPVPGCRWPRARRRGATAGRPAERRARGRPASTRSGPPSPVALEAKWAAWYRADYGVVWGLKSPARPLELLNVMTKELGTDRVMFDLHYWKGDSVLRMFKATSNNYIILPRCLDIRDIQAGLPLQIHHRSNGAAAVKKHANIPNPSPYLQLSKYRVFIIKWNKVAVPRED